MEIKPKITHERVKLSRLETETSFQREVQGKHPIVVNGYDENDEGIIIVAVVDGDYLVVDGKQRVTQKRLAILRGEDLNNDIQAVIHHGVSLAYASDLFVRIDAGRKALTSYDKYRAALAAGHPDAVSVDRVSRRNGLTVSSGGGKNSRLTSPGTAQAIVRQYGEEILDRALAICVSLYPGQNPHVRMLEGLAIALNTDDPKHSKLLRDHGDSYFVRRLQQYAGGSHLALETKVRDKALAAKDSPFSREDRHKDSPALWAYGMLQILGTRYYNS